jgi:hypothetical protein
MIKLLLLVLYVNLYIQLINCTTIDLFINGIDVRHYPNVSLGLEYNNDNKHQCTNDGVKRTFNVNDPEDREILYTPNRRRQSETLEDGHQQNLQLAIVLALGGHHSQYYDYGPSGSLNGLMAVWDSWIGIYLSIYLSNYLII